MAEFQERVVLLEHSFMLRAHQLAKVVSETSKMIRVVYWHSGREEWGEEVKSRRKDALTADLGPAASASPRQLDQIFDRLCALRDERERRITAANNDYELGMKRITL